jgi:hypothetical protein
MQVLKSITVVDTLCVSPYPLYNRLSTTLVNDSVQLLRHLHEIGATAIYVRPEVIQLEGEQLGLGERSMEL